MTQAEIKRKIAAATRAAQDGLDRVDRGAAENLLRMYQAAAGDIRARITGNYDAGSNPVPLGYMQVLLKDVLGYMEKLSTARNGLLTEELGNAATAGVVPTPTAPTSELAEKAVKFVNDFAAADGLQLSDRLWRVDNDARTRMSKVIQSAIIQGHGAASAAQEFTAKGVRIPAEIKAQAEAGTAVGVAKAAADTLLTAPNNQYEKSLRVFRTELRRAHHAAFEASTSDTPGLAGYRYMLSPLHRREDICDHYATADLHGLGAGIFPPGKIPIPAHPNTRSYAQPVFWDEIQPIKSPPAAPAPGDGEDAAAVDYAAIRSAQLTEYQRRLAANGLPADRAEAGRRADLVNQCLCLAGGQVVQLSEPSGATFRLADAAWLSEWLKKIPPCPVFTRKSALQKAYEEFMNLSLGEQIATLYNAYLVGYAGMKVIQITYDSGIIGDIFYGGIVEPAKAITGMAKQALGAMSEEFAATAVKIENAVLEALPDNVSMLLKEGITAASVMKLPDGKLKSVAELIVKGKSAAWEAFGKDAAEAQARLMNYISLVAKDAGGKLDEVAAKIDEWWYNSPFSREIREYDEDNVPIVNTVAKAEFALKAIIGHKLTESDRLAASLYTGEGYKELNNALRREVQSGGRVSERTQYLANMVSRMMRKLPKWQGSSLWRGMKMPSSAAAFFEKNLREIQRTDGVFTMPGFASTSIEKSVAEEFSSVFSGGVLIEIENPKKARWVGGLSQYAHEKEALYDTMSMFKVVSIEKSTFGRMLVKLREA